MDEIHCDRCDHRVKPTGRKLTYFEVGNLYEYQCVDCGQKMWVFGEKEDKKEKKK
jgi:DNA-directed RNA polymerase subunit RPC12/RpoP